MLDVGPLGLAFVSEAVGDCLELGRRPRLAPAVGPILAAVGSLRDRRRTGMAKCPPGRSTSQGDRCETYSAVTCIPRGQTDVGGVGLCQPVFLFGLP